MDCSRAHAVENCLPKDSHPNVRRLVEHNLARCDERLQSDGPLAVRTVGIIGAGLMGRAVAAASIAARINVVLVDADPAALEHSPKGIAAEWTFLSEIPGANGVSPGATAGLPSSAFPKNMLRTSRDLDDLSNCDLVLESITEKLDVKQALYAQLEPQLAERTVLTSNTSTIPIAQLAAELKRPERFCGLHFFHPVGRRPLAEVIRGRDTSASTLATAVGYARSINKMAMVVNDGPGFLVNRLLLPYLAEAVELLADGVPIKRVEAVATRFGMAKGPLHLLDEIGLDTAVAGGRTLWMAFPDRIVISPVMIALYKAKRFGVKSGAGFFNYQPEQPNDPQGVPGPKRSGGPEKHGPGSGQRYPEIATGETPVALKKTLHEPPVDPFALEKITEWSRPPQTLTDDDIRDRLFLPMILEATRLLKEKIVTDPQDIDLGALFGLGFPAPRGGLLHWADSITAAAILDRLGSFGPRVEPTCLLRNMASEKRTFY